MNMIPVDSTNLSSVGYDDSTSTLYIRFNRGGLYAYYDVPRNIFTGLLNAYSKGEYHKEHIKNIYRYSRI